ncbi:hypothetical protein AAV99_09580 [Aurantiacibacter marinus]|uniref:Putative Flp pilus-assembly TadG-like N-terminal domain-containing protein n=2 Tax=Aurantiacibacter marinus TaxID=874156 RepID=A0A0H0XPK2_9SPHN|nr:pilus assembly protein TadG-related protein [Aurantiacibacter marinus]KLI63931.1 hypothetical protein AAV99_09580 [Aurantiacibacter marinus]
MIAASLFPLMALIGGGIDMGRGYLAQSRLQQACDAGTLAARKRLGSSVAVDGIVPADVAETGRRFFNINFRDGAYGTENRTFTMALENDYSLTAVATVDVPTTLMAVFGYTEMPVEVSCGSIQSFNNLDIMMVVDTTGSMRHTNAGDTLSRLESLKQVIRDFYTTIDANKAPNTEIRYGFVPYATNVNVGHLLSDDWIVDAWTYQGREDTGIRVPSEEISYTYYRNWQDVSGTRDEWAVSSSYAATFNPSPNPDEPGTYTCEGTQPANSWSTQNVDDEASERTEVQAEPPAILRIVDGQKTHNGTRYRTVRNGDTCNIEASTDSGYVQSYEKVQVIPSIERTMWRYKPITHDVSSWRSEQDGCIEERDTYPIDDFDNVDFSRALDLDIDLIPDAGNPSTQWRPRYPEEIYVRQIKTDGTGTFATQAKTTSDEYVSSGTWWFSDCPPAAQRLAQLSSAELDTYLDTLVPYGATYHDIGMIWGGRLLSPTGLFAADNADTIGRTRGRHMIWLTDGQTEPYDLAYGVYGIDGLDQRRWQPGGSTSLSQTVEQRFGVACEQVKNRNITVWVVAFGTVLNPIMEECGGPGRTFQASNADELGDVFQEIASSMSELRISR